MTQQSETRRRLEEIDRNIDIYMREPWPLDEQSTTPKADVTFLRQQLRELERVAKGYLEWMENDDTGITPELALRRKLDELGGERKEKGNE